MAWEPVTSDKVLLDCSVQPLKSVRFDLRLTDQHLCYSKLRTLPKPDRYETIIVERKSISQVQIRKLSPWMLRANGLLLLAVATGSLFLRSTPKHYTIPGFVIMGLFLLGGLSLFSSSNRWRLSFSDNEKTHRIVQPATPRKQASNTMASSLKEAARLLKEDQEADDTR